MSFIVAKVTLKDKEPKVHTEHFFDIESLENVGYVIKAHLMLWGIYHFFEDPKVGVPELIYEFWRTPKSTTMGSSEDISLTMFLESLWNCQ